MSGIKVLVVDDSAFMRQVISDIINKDPDLSVAGTAKNGQDALEKIKSLQPQVVTLDVEMPIMDGITTLEEIMKNHPLPVVMFSSLTKQGADATLRALEKGAIDFMLKPSATKIHSIADELCNKIKIAAKSKVQTERKKTFNFLPVIKKEKKSSLVIKHTKQDKIEQMILIGTSTGGPKALQEVLPLLPADIPAAILVVQHMPAGFTRSLSERLNTLSEIIVKEAEQGEILKNGVAYIAPGDYHLKIENNGGTINVKLTQEPPVSGHRPSVNAMMESVCNSFYGRLVGVIMTGMGNDGTSGLKLIKEKQGINIAEDESTCVVFGMPKAAIQANSIDHIVPLNQISQTIIKMLK